MWKRIWAFLLDLWRDGYAVLGAVSPLLSATFAIAKAADVQIINLRDISYGWGLLPITIWLFVAYLRCRSRSLPSALKPTFRMDDTDCVCRNIPWVNPNGDRLIVTYFRVKVEAIGNAIISGCSANLTSLVRVGDGDNLLKGEFPELPFSRRDMPDTFDKSIKPMVPVHLDILAAHRGCGIILLFREPRNATVDWNSLFKNAGDYRMHIVINAANCAPCEFNAIFKWTLDPDTSSLVI
jgi:hypothetical protein